MDGGQGGPGGHSLRHRTFQATGSSEALSVHEGPHRHSHRPGQAVPVALFHRWANSKYRDVPNFLEATQLVSGDASCGNKVAWQPSGALHWPAVRRPLLERGSENRPRCRPWGTQRWKAILEMTSTDAAAV